MQQVAFLKASNPGAYHHFGEGGSLPGHTGNSLALSRDGNTIAVGASHESSGARGIDGQPDEAAYAAGSVHVFAREGAGWSPQAYVKASNAESGDHFGSAVSLSADGNTMAVAAHWERSDATGVSGNQADNSIPQAGAVYVFTRSGSTWSQQAYLKASNTGEKGDANDPGNLPNGDQFGFALALSGDGDTLAVTALTEDSNATGINGDQTDNSARSSSAVYVFTRSGTTWSQQAYVKTSSAPEDSAGNLFGFSLGLTDDGNMLAVGVYDEAGSSREINGPIDAERRGAGAAYVFTRSGSTWSRQAYLKVANAENSDSWGTSLALNDDGSTLALGSVDEDCEATGINPSGCGDEDLASAGGSMGAAAVFVRDGTTWTQQAYIKASNTDEQDWFGSKLALTGDGDTLAVAAALEDSAAQGINGRQDDDSAVDAGVVYMFRRTGTTWAQEAYIKSTHNEAFDEFGNTVALSSDGRTMVVGARGEDSGVAGVNGDETDNSVDESGAVYVFAR